MEVHMPYVDLTLEGDAARLRAEKKGFSEPSFSAETAARTVKLELVCSSFSDPGEDWCEWRAYDATGQVIAQTLSNGY
jgi:hypothetical protein